MLNIKFIFFYFLLFILSCVPISNTYSQEKTYSSEADLKKAAKKYFDTKQYSEAFPLYSQLLSNYSKDANFNFRFGVCMLFVSDDKTKPLQYLEYAAKQKDVDKDVYFFLAKTYHLNYRFDEAIVQYNNYKKNSSSADQKKNQVDRLIEMCRNGKTLLKNITNLKVLDKKRVSDLDFYKSYDFSGIGGNIVVKPDEFQTYFDLKSQEKFITYLGVKKDVIYYSSYGYDGKSKRDIFKIVKLPNGDWSSPLNLGPTINTEMDEDYPFISNNGKTLYFSSKGHNSMGGYDIFKSNWDEQASKWGEPINLDFAINSPDDDIMYVTDSLEQVAYFASKRNSPYAQIDVYKIETARKQFNLAVLNGTINNNTGIAFSNVKITVKNVSTGDIIGVYYSDDEGHYTITAPVASKLILNFEPNGSDAQIGVVELPSTSNFRPFRQDVTLNTNAKQPVFTNYFNDEVDENTYIKLISLIKDKARLDVSDSETEVSGIDLSERDSVVNQSASLTSEVDSSEHLNNNLVGTPSAFTNNDITKIAYDDANEIQKDATDLASQAEQALYVANEKNKQVQLLKVNKDTLNHLNDSQSTQEKITQLSKEAILAYNIAVKLQNDAAFKQNEADLAKKYANELEVASKTNSANAIQLLDVQKKQLEHLTQNSKKTEYSSNSIQLEAENKHKELDIAKRNSISLNNDIVGIDEEIQRLNQSIESTNNGLLKDGLKGQINDLEIEKTGKLQELKNNDLKIKSLMAESANLDNEVSLVQQLFAQIKSEDTHKADYHESIDQNKLREQVTDLQTLNDSKLSSISLVSTDSVKVSPEKESPQFVKSSDTNLIAQTALIQSTQINVNSSEPAQGTDNINMSSLNISSQNIGPKTYLTDTVTGSFEKSMGKLPIKMLKSDTIVNITDRNISVKDTITNSNYSIQHKDTDQVILNNQKKLKAYALAFSSMNNDDLTMADLFNDQALNYLSTSKKLKIQSQAAISSLESQTLLNQSEEANKSAIDYQNKALQIYHRYNSDTIKIKEYPDALSEVSSKKVEKDSVNNPSIEVHQVTPYNVDRQKEQFDATSTQKIKNDSNAKHGSYKPINNYRNQADIMALKIDSLLKTIDLIPNGEAVPDSLSKLVARDQADFRLLIHLADSCDDAGKVIETESVGNSTVNLINNETTSKSEVSTKEIDAISRKHTNKNASPTHDLINANSNEGFEFVEKSIYSDKFPIPINPKLPEGLVFKVQIGAFKNPIKQDVFKGMTPIMGEKTNENLIRYTAGLFKNIEPAINARNTIRNLGYKDAFIVAFYNGKRIRLNEATKLKEADLPLNASVKNNVASTPKETLNTKGATVETSDNNDDSINKLNSRIVDISTTTGIIYTIQIGVYSKEIPVNTFANLQSIYTELLPNGLKRYTSGSYLDMNSAITAKEKIVSMGIKDAFIIVYKDGKRFTVNSSVANRSNVLDTTAQVALKRNQNIVYKIQVGAYASEIPIEIANKMISVASMGVSVSKDADGLNIFTIGSFNSYSDALRIRDEIIEKGIKDAFIVAYNQNVKISIEKAKLYQTR